MSFFVLSVTGLEVDMLPSSDQQDVRSLLEPSEDFLPWKSHSAAKVEEKDGCYLDVMLGGAVEPPHSLPEVPTPEFLINEINKPFLVRYSIVTQTVSIPLSWYSSFIALITIRKCLIYWLSSLPAYTPCPLLEHILRTGHLPPLFTALSQGLLHVWPKSWEI